MAENSTCLFFLRRRIDGPLKQLAIFTPVKTRESISEAEPLGNGGVIGNLFTLEPLGGYPGEPPTTQEQKSCASVVLLSVLLTQVGSRPQAGCAEIEGNCISIKIDGVRGFVLPHDKQP
jgi:hypothetical protein